MKLRVLLVVTCLLSSGFILPSPALARQCVWNNAGFVLNVTWIARGSVRRIDVIPLGRGVCSPDNDQEYKVVLSVVGGALGQTLVQGAVAVAASMLAVPVGTAVSGAVTKAVSGFAFAAKNFTLLGVSKTYGGIVSAMVAGGVNGLDGMALKAARDAIPDSTQIFYAGIPNQDRYLDVWGTIFSPQCVQNETTGLITERHAPVGTLGIGEVTLLGVGVDHQVYTRQRLNDPWVLVPYSGDVKSITVIGGDTLVGVSLDNYLFRRTPLDGSWKLIPNSGCLQKIATMPDGMSLIGWGCSSSNDLNTWPANASWWRMATSNNTGSFLSLDSMPNGAIIGVGNDYSLWTRADVDSSPWISVPNSGTVISVAVLLDGTIVAVGSDNHLYQRNSLFSDWEILPNNNVAMQAITHSALIR